jgi:hypothetical protein
VLLGAVPLELALAWGPLPILVFELAWLAALVLGPASAASRRLRPAGAVPGKRPIGGFTRS